MKHILIMALGLGLTGFAAAPAFAQEYYSDEGDDSGASRGTVYVEPSGDDYSMDRDVVTGSIGTADARFRGNLCRDDRDNPDFPNNRNGCKSSDNFNGRRGDNFGNNRNNNGNSPD